MREVKGSTDITGEDFGASLGEGYKAYAKDDGGPFVRFRTHIQDRRGMVKDLPQAQGNYRDYDQTNTVNLS